STRSDTRSGMKFSRLWYTATARSPRRKEIEPESGYSPIAKKPRRRQISRKDAKAPSKTKEDKRQKQSKPGPGRLFSFFFSCVFFAVFASLREICLLLGFFPGVLIQNRVANPGLGYQNNSCTSHRRPA